MNRIWKLTIGFSVLSVVILTSGYFVDHHRCKQINYQRAGYELPETFFISAKQCIGAASAVQLRHYARDV